MNLLAWSGFVLLTALAIVGTLRCAKPERTAAQIREIHKQRRNRRGQPRTN
jgi:hypothetical protein